MKLFGFAFVVHVLVVPQIAGARAALSTIGSVDMLAIGLTVVLEACSLLAHARLSQRLLASAHGPSLGVSYGAVLASTGVGHVVPGGLATTAAVQHRLFSRGGVRADELGFALCAQSIGSAVALHGLLWSALVMSVAAGGFQRLDAVAATVSAILIVSSITLSVGLLRHRAGLARRIATVVGRVPRVGAAGVEAGLVRLEGRLTELCADRRRLRLVVGLATTRRLLDVAVLWTAIAAFGPGPGLVGLMAAYALAGVLASVPLSPGGIGVVEAVLIPTLVGCGVPVAQATIGVVAYRLVTFWLPIPVGAAAYVAVHQATRRPHPDRLCADIHPVLDLPPHIGVETVADTLGQTEANVGLSALQTC